jgi:tRNA threonylcarbamoyladenosine biosynthesis protein TsaB
LITLAIDTCEARGSIAIRRGGTAVALKKHEGNSDYSAWLLPAVEQVLAEAGIRLEQVDLLAVATGPGSFTGLRVGLTTVKAWAEVYGKPIVGASRLEAIARSQVAATSFVAASHDGQRGQLFAGLYRSMSGRLARVGDERVISPEELLELIESQVGTEPVTWISLDPERIADLEAWKHRLARGDIMQLCPPDLACSIGILAEERAILGEFTDPLELDANYVRRSDAEIFWKGPPSHAR